MSLGVNRKRSAVDFGTVSKNTVATFASTSEAETQKSSPISGGVEKNQIRNAMFDADNRYPGIAEYGHNRTPVATNGIGSSWNKNLMPQDWSRFSSVYTNTGVDYNTFLGNYYFNPRKNRQGIYEDMGSIHPPSSGRSAVSGDQYNVGTVPADRGIGLYGVGGYLNARNSDPDRTAGDTSLVGCRTHGYTIDGASTWSGIKDNAWVKHSVQSSVIVPAGYGTSHSSDITVVKKIKYGAWVQVLSTDDFNGKNFGSIELTQDYVYRPDDLDLGTDAAGGDRAGVIRSDRIFIKKSGQTIPDPNIASPSHFDANGLSAMYNRGLAWDHNNANANLDISGVKGATNRTSHYYPQSFSWPSSGTLTGTTVESSDYREFKKIEREVTFGTNDDPATGTFANTLMPSGALGSSPQNWGKRFLKLELCFYESIANLQSATSSTPTGSIRFFSPYVQFYDDNDNLLDQWWTYDTLNDPNYSE